MQHYVPQRVPRDPSHFSLPTTFSSMYNTKGVSAIATVAELRMETADILKMLEEVPVICVQRNNTPEAAILPRRR